MQDSTANIISNLFSSIVTMCKNINVPGMNFSFFGMWVGVFLFAMLSAFLLAFFGFGGRFGAASLGGMYHDKVSAKAKKDGKTFGQRVKEILKTE